MVMMQQRGKFFYLWLSWFILELRRCKQHFPLKRWEISTRIHGVTSQTIELLDIFVISLETAKPFPFMSMSGHFIKLSICQRAQCLFFLPEMQRAPALHSACAERKQCGQQTCY
jgi:hypothetical protein